MEDAASRQSYALNAPAVICEVIEGDLIFVHFDSGLYYSVRGLGAEIMQQILAGSAPHAVSAKLAEHFQRPLAEVHSDMEDFLRGLESEKLIVHCESVPAQVPAAPIVGRSYERPRFEKFDDMADQLLLDKIEDESQPATWTIPVAAPGP